MSKRKNNLITQAKFDKESHLDKIQLSYFNDKIVLSDSDKQRKARWEFAFSLLEEMYSFQQAAKMLVTKYGVGQATAYRDIKQATALFGDIREVKRKGVVVVMREAYWRIYQQAIKSNDAELQIKALDKFYALFPDDEKDAEMLDKLSANNYIIKLDNETKKYLKEAISGGVVDFNKFDTEEADFEVVEDGSK